jgi:hypothetical protein
MNFLEIMKKSIFKILAKKGRNYTAGLTLVLFLSPAITLSAAKISGEAGFALGEYFNPQKQVAKPLATDDDTVYRVEPRTSLKKIDYVLLRLGQENRIKRITVFSHAMEPEFCQIKKQDLRKSMEIQHPMLGYYAMDDSEMFYEDSRIFTIECVTYDGKVRMKREYSDELLEK